MIAAWTDKLIDVRTRDGRDLWVLVHAEVQGAAQVEFAKRMFQYNDRIRDRYDRPVVSLAVLSDAYEEQQRMPYITTVEQAGIDKGVIIGEQQGVKNAPLTLGVKPPQEHPHHQARGAKSRAFSIAAESPVARILNSPRLASIASAPASALSQAMAP